MIDVVLAHRPGMEGDRAHLRRPAHHGHLGRADLVRVAPGRELDARRLEVVGRAARDPLLEERVAAALLARGQDDPRVHALRPALERGRPPLQGAHDAVLDRQVVLDDVELGDLAPCARSRGRSRDRDSRPAARARRRRPWWRRRWPSAKEDGAQGPLPANCAITEFASVLSPAEASGMAGERKRAIARWWLGATRLTRVLALMAAVAATVTVVEVATGAYAESGPTNDLFAIGQGTGQTAGDGADRQHRAEPPLDGHAARALRPGLEARAGRRRPRARRVGEANGLSCNVVVGRPPGHRGRLQGLPLHRRPRATSAPSTTPR